MPTNTPNLNLTTYNVATEGDVLFINAWESLVGTLATSNMNKIDGFAGTTTATLQLLQQRPGSTHIEISSEDGVNYTATVSGLMSLSSGMIIYLQPNLSNTGNPYLNINGLGNKTMYKTDETGSNIQLEVGDLIPYRRIIMVYDGFSWVAVGGLNLSDYKIEGAITSLLEIGVTNSPVASSILVSDGKILGSSVSHNATLDEDEFEKLTLATSGITPGTYKGTTYDAYGRATSSSGKVDGAEIFINSFGTGGLLAVSSTYGLSDSGKKAEDFVQTTGNQSIAGTKTFSTIPELPSSNPTTSNQAVRKAYVDTNFIPTTVVSTSSGANLIPKASALGKIDEGWLPDKTVSIDAIYWDDIVETGAGKMYWTVPSSLSGYTIKSITAVVKTPPNSTMSLAMVKSYPSSATIKSGITISSGLYTSGAIAPTVNTVSSGDIWRFDVPTGNAVAKGLQFIVVLEKITAG